jgi:hypothetical protein
MRALRSAAVVLLLAASVGLTAVAFDVLHSRDAIRDGDRKLAASPASASWAPSTVFSPSISRGLLGLDSAVRLRRAMQSFAAVRAAGAGYDNGLSESRARGELEAALSQLGQARDHVIASYADNMLGILAFSDASQTGPIAPAPVEQSVADFEAGIRADPANADAKFNLERLLQELVARGLRQGPSSNGGGPTKGHRGASGGLPGRGY